jgi:hypothetical protein
MNQRAVAYSVQEAFFQFGLFLVRLRSHFPPYYDASFRGGI